MKTPILGQSYTAISRNAACSRMVNLFIEFVPDGGKEPGFLQRAPGMRLLATIGTGPIRGTWQYGNYGYVVSGQYLYRVDSTWNYLQIGQVAGSGPVSMADNGTQLFIACNPEGFIYNVATNVFQQITDPDFPGAVTVGYLDGYFVFTQPDTQLVWVTSLLDGTAIDPLEFASATGAPDNLVAVVVDHKEAWLLGVKSAEVWYDSADIDFPLSPVQGAFIEIGCMAPYSAVKLDNSIFWLGSDKQGDGIVFRSVGYQAKRISTPAVEWQLQQYDNLSEAIAYSYQKNGHIFYVLIIPGQSTSWVYDVTTEAWHERAGFQDGAFTRHRSNCAMNFNREIVVGDFENGNIYALDHDVCTDNGSTQKWLRSWRALAPGKNTLQRATHHSLQLDCETGVGVVSGQGNDPKVFLRWSDDAGWNWSSEHWRSMGKIGEKFTRVIWRRLGSTDKLRDRVYEISGTDPVKVIISGAELISGSTNA